MALHQYDIIIIGAGASALMAAYELRESGKKIAVVEAKEHVGGRAAGFQINGFERLVEPGAEFIHGDLELTLSLLKKAGISYHKTGGEFWHKYGGHWAQQEEFIEDPDSLEKKLKALDKDISVYEFLDEHLKGDHLHETRLSLRNYVEGYFAADTHRASTFALRDELDHPQEQQYRIDGGYSKLFDYLYQQCNKSGTVFYFSHPVNAIHWETGKVDVVAPNKTFTAQKAIVTVPIGVLQNQGIQFLPSLAQQELAARQLGFGDVIKTILQFSEPFWKDQTLMQGKDFSKLSFVFSEEIIPTWWTYYPENSATLVGWCGGPHTNALKYLTESAITEKAIRALSRIFGLTEEMLQQKLLASHVANWNKDPYSLGGYSYEVVNGNESKNILKQPVDNTIYFSGEGLFEGQEIGTVNAALEMGKKTAQEILTSFKN